MRRRTAVAVALALASLSIITAQTGLPSPPRNVRILAEGSPEFPPTEPPPPPEPPPQPCVIPAASGGPQRAL